MLEFARIWKGVERVVFSRTLDPHVDPGSRLVRDGAVADVERLKARPGYDMDVGVPPLAEPIGLRLIETRRFDSGVVGLRCEADR